MLRRKKTEPRTPYLLNLNQDIVAWSQKRKCGLKYVIYSLGGPIRTLGTDDVATRRLSRGLGNKKDRVAPTLSFLLVMLVE
jgi:hypothetical protein